MLFLGHEIGSVNQWYHCCAALRHQLSVYRRSVKRPRIRLEDNLTWRAQDHIICCHNFRREAPRQCGSGGGARAGSPDGAHTEHQSGITAVLQWHTTRATGALILNRRLAPWRGGSICFRRRDSRTRTGLGQSRWGGSACAHASVRIEGNRTLRRARFRGKQRGQSEFSRG